MFCTTAAATCVTDFCLTPQASINLGMWHYTTTRAWPPASPNNDSKTCTPSKTVFLSPSSAMQSIMTIRKDGATFAGTWSMLAHAGRSPVGFYWRRVVETVQCEAFESGSPPASFSGSLLLQLWVAARLSTSAAASLLPCGCDRDCSSPCT